MSRGYSFSAWLLITAAWLWVPNSTLARGLQASPHVCDDLPDVETLLGESTGLQFPMDWDFFESIGLWEEPKPRSFTRLQLIWDRAEFQPLVSDVQRGRTLRLRARDTSDDGRLPQLEMVVPHRLEAARIDTSFRLELKPLGFSGHSYAQPLAIRYDSELELGRNLGMGPLVQPTGGSN